MQLGSRCSCHSPGHYVQSRPVRVRVTSAAASRRPDGPPAETDGDSRRAIAIILSVSLLPLSAAGPPSVTAATEGSEVPPGASLKPSAPGSSPYDNLLRAPADFLRARQRVNGGSKILSPLRASRQRLQAAENVVRRVNIYDPNPAIYREALDMIRTASLNCYGYEALPGDSIETRASLLQRKLGIADACTFRIVAKAITAVMGNSKKKNQLKADLMSQLDELVMSYELLDTTLLAAWNGDAYAVDQVPQKLQFTIAHTNSFETMLERCLDLPPSNVAPSPISSLSLTRLRQALGQTVQPLS